MNHIHMNYENVLHSLQYMCFVSVHFKRLLHVRNANCKYTEAERAWEDIEGYLQVFPDHCKATLFAEYCSLLFAQSLYDKVTSPIVSPQNITFCMCLFQSLLNRMTFSSLNINKTIYYFIIYSFS